MTARGLGRLRDRVAIVVGAGSSGPGWGIGKATAVLFAREGARVVADLTRACVDRFGRIDVLQNNVGVVSLGGGVATTDDAWDRTLAVNLRSFFLTCRSVLPVMEAQGRGAIVNVASIASIRWTGLPYAAYAASKAAVNQLTQSVAVEYAAKGIRCNAVLPGLMDTPLVAASLAEAYGGDLEAARAARNARVPTGATGDAWDVAHASLFLASDEARYITAHCLVVDGGLTAVAG